MPSIDTILVASSPGEARLALLADGEVVELLIERGQAAHGDVIAGRVAKVDRRVGLVFVEIGEAQPAVAKKLGRWSEGQAVTVQVVAPARRGKGAVVVASDAVPAGQLSLAASGLRRALVLAGPPPQILADDSATLAALRPYPATLARRCFADAEEALTEALAPSIPLPAGGAIHFAETEGGAVIDVDGGPQPAEAANRAALPLIARHLRLRALAGHILVDAIPRGRRHAQELAATLRDMVQDDPTPTRIAGVTPLGLIELTRDRHRASLAETLLAPSAQTPSAETVALAGLRALLAEAEARPAARLALGLPPDAIALLDSRPALRAEAVERLARPLVLVPRAGQAGHSLEEAS